MAQQGGAARGRASGADDRGDGDRNGERQSLVALAARRDETGGLDRAEVRPAAGASRNAVHLVGRLGATAQERTLPSGDAVLTFYVVVDRGVTGPGSARPRPG